MSDKNYAPVCGIYCDNCGFLGEQCEGCGYVDGKPFWTTQIPSGVCPPHDCCRNQKQMEHCGLCEDFPCKIFLELRDPNMSDGEFQKSLKTRREALKRRTEIGTENGCWKFPAANKTNAADAKSARLICDVSPPPAIVAFCKSHTEPEQSNQGGLYDLSGSD